MKFNINKILSDWAYRVDDGQPNQLNTDHVNVLREVLYNFGLPYKFINEYVSNIQEIDFRSQDAFKKYNAKHKMRKTTKVNIAGKDTTAGEVDSTETKSGTEDTLINKATKKGSTPKQIAENFKKDKQSLNYSLNMTTTESKLKADKKGTKHLGLGTDASRAGESMVCTGIDNIKSMMSEVNSTTGKPHTFLEALEIMQTQFTELVNTDDHILNSKKGKEWVGSAIASLKKIEKEVGFENIQNVAWDTKAGRRAIGVDEHVKTSSDAFIQRKDGTVLGVSLKKDGKVFIVSGGWDTQSKTIVEGVKKEMFDSKTGEPNSPEELKAFKAIEKAFDVTNHTKDVDKALKAATDTVGLEELKASLEKLKEDIGWDEKTQKASIKSQFFSGAGVPDYIKALEDPELLTRIAAGRDASSGTDRKAYAKLLQTYHKSEADKIRAADDKITKNLFQTIKKHPKAEKAIKKFVIKSLHLMEALGLNEETKEGGIDDFATFYGSGDDGAILNEETISTLLGKKFTDTLAKMRLNPPTASIDELNKIIEDQIEFDIDNEKIIFKHENNSKYPLFDMGGRAKGILNSLAIEMAQTGLMAYALIEGTFDHKKWPQAMQDKYAEQIKQQEQESEIEGEE